jgi:hypothetical protein
MQRACAAHHGAQALANQPAAGRMEAAFPIDRAGFRPIALTPGAFS